MERREREAHREDEEEVPEGLEHGEEELVENEPEMEP